MRRLTPATLTLVMFGIVGVLIVGYVAKTMLANQVKPPAPPAMRDMPMAVADIAPGTVITENHLGVGRHRRDQLASDMLLANRVIVGRVAKGPIKAATPITAGQLYQPGELPPLEVGDGMRAVSVEVGGGGAMVDGMIKPGQHVDILFSAAGGMGGNDPALQGGLTMRLFEGVKILAINRNFTQSSVDRGGNNVTLELTEAQTNILVLARDHGKLTLTYNPTNAVGDGGITLPNTERVTMHEILGLKRQAPAKEPFQTEIYRGNAGRITNHFDEKGRFLNGGYGGGGNIPAAAMGGLNAGAPYVLPNDATTNDAPQNNDRNNVPAQGINRSAPQQQPQGQPINNPAASRVPTASLPSRLPN